ncbi:Predicted xylanase/chitin deacetylase [Aquiflexum balticum DSM 16537]|uniref:Predicted xylanase/chitin deacetylase n=1 Tax=Aquiflexum balticum DSM 16537 TaxID=758820 RepID=A0A1W2HBA4_9BACT|nr:polysaccharide deacetylase family protein [Aquiflexum balticum]SMD46071.1 Predicted xylanase/chitin deacetylase [Aquiflexum balticum DSM 16537]
MKNSFRFFLIGCISFLILSCQNDIPKQPGICFSFDDNYLDQWVGILPLLEKYDAKVTFFITGVGSLNDQEKIWLNQLLEAGHEIGAHGEQHLSMNSYIKEKGLRAYWNKEIREHLDSFDKLGIQPKTLAYPFGEKNVFIDLFLRFKFNSARSVVRLNPINESLEKAVTNSTPSKFRYYSLGVDNHEFEDLNLLVPFMDKAQRNNEVFFMHAHQIGLNGDYHISPIRLEKILEMAQLRDMRFFTFNQLN